MRMTLLKMTQMILSSMDSDEVSSISDTVESLQVVDQIESCFNDIISTIDFPEMWTLFELEPSLDVGKPTLLTIPENISHFEWLQYDMNDPDENDDRNWRHLYPMERQHFLDRMNSLSLDDDRVFSYEFSVGADDFEIRGYNNTDPSYYTIIDNRHIIFDNFDVTEGETVVANRTMGYGMVIPSFEREDDFIPPLQPRQFTLLYNEAKAQCFAELKQMTNARAEQKARRGWTQSQRKKAAGPSAEISHCWTPNYGRNR